MTQLHDDVNGLGDAWYAGRLDPETEAEAEDRPWPAAVDQDSSQEWDRDILEPSAQPAGGEPLFEQLRSAYLEHDDSGEWARDSDTGGWAADDSGRWEAGVATAYEDDDSRYGWVDAPATWESESDHEEGWDDAEELDDHDEEEEE